MTENRIVSEFRLIKQDYAYNGDIMCEDDPRVARLKRIIDTKLSQVDKTIILLYCDCQSYRKLGKKMHLSHMTIRREVIRIKNIILDEYYNGTIGKDSEGIENDGGQDERGSENL